MSRLARVSGFGLGASRALSLQETNISLSKLISRLTRDLDSCVSYPNFVRELLLDGMQPVIDYFKVLGTICFTICEVPRRAGNQKEALLRNPWNSVTWRKENKYRYEIRKVSNVTEKGSPKKAKGCI